MSATEKEAEPTALPEGVLCVRLGTGANCSSIGSAVELLFLSATAGAALLTALASVLEPVRDEDDEAEPREKTE